MAENNFDAEKYARASAREWQQTADGWHKWNWLLEEMAEEATGLMLRLARIAEGNRVLDIAAGDGATALHAARLTGPDGYVLATDISPGLLAYAAAAADEAGLDHIETRVMDGGNLDLTGASFDAVICRLGLMLIPNTIQVLKGIHRVLKDGGRFSAAVISVPEMNPWISIPARIAMKHACLPPPPPGAPGLFSLSGKGVLEGALQAAGFREVEGHVVSVSMRLKSAAECVTYLQDTGGALHTILAPVSETARQNAWSEMEAALSQFEQGDAFVSPAEMIIAAGTK